MKYSPCEHLNPDGWTEGLDYGTCDSCALEQAEARIALLEGLLCKVHEDCQHDEHLAFACGDREPPRKGDLVWWPAAGTVREVFSAGTTHALLLTKDGLWDHQVPLANLVVLKRAEPKP